MNLGQVDLNLLVVLDALLREQNVTRAAERLHMSQPATSTALARLRKVLGDPLLVKHGRYLQLTPRAEALVDPVRDVLATIEQSIVKPPGFDPAHDRRTFGVIASDYVGMMLIRPLLGRIGGLAPNLSLELAQISGHFLRLLERDEIDLAILPESLAEGERLGDCASVPVLADRFVGAVWRGHPLAGGSLPAAALAEHPYLAFAPPDGFSLIEEDLDKAGISRRVEATAISFVTMPFLLAGTGLVTIIPERLGRQVADAAGIVLLEPEFEIRAVRESAYWHSRRNSDPGHRWLREQLVAVVG
ncbi:MULTISPECIES: LysR family transcriptional regulator [Amycolatopsis]|uniref:LysR family transcriptional regulator n=1 Tax=Amycolatopsis thermalba TaxID=944492 RepID=A0ABY4NXL8_9PSEU|nr:MULTISPECIES: LysR family transcriptional regulator [Amycolatopsis]OXM72292.1 LysR family transcriptional regulator [Amycolatopsis sp. KNN50.9b]UQS24773.1 LysR family transcriptional regulator [Amycolatopsis thermalba]